MDSYDNAFTLFFKTRKKSILARGENSNYITDFPQDLYIYIHETKKEFPLISYEWFPRKAKKILGDNNTLILVSASKNLNQNLEFNIKKKELKSYRKKGKLDFIISSYAKTCGYSNLESNFTCNLYKPLISNNLVN